jgi:hypothetical protein
VHAGKFHFGKPPFAIVGLFEVLLPKTPPTRVAPNSVCAGGPVEAMRRRVTELRKQSLTSTSKNARVVPKNRKKPHPHR